MSTASKFLSIFHSNPHPEPIGTASHPLNVMFEELEEVRDRWLETAFEKALPLKVYDAAADLLIDVCLRTFPEDTRFYLDQDVGTKRGVGVELAKHIRTYYPKAHIQLITEYPKWMFEIELARGLLNEVSGKYPEPFSISRSTALEKKSDQRKWKSWLATKRIFVGLFALLVPAFANAADFEATLQSLVTGVIGRILPIFALYHCGEAAFAWSQDKPEAKDKMKTVAIGTVALLGINAVWAWLRAHLK